MTLSKMSSESMRGAITELEKALYNHEQWSENIYATLACRLPPDARDLSREAHHNCRFGQWYFGPGAAAFTSHPGFVQIDAEHERMHRFAARLLQASARGEATSLQDYEQFVTALKRLRLEIATLRHELEDALYNLDPLTGTPGRIGMLTRLREEHELVKRKVHACCLVMMDLDHFKAINDYYGHLAGDAVLVEFARHVTSHLRPYDKVFRFGGEEFLICLPATELAEGRDIVERLRKELGALEHRGGGNECFHVTVSFGIATLDPEVPVEQSIDRADKALYLAKLTGRDRIAIWDPSMSASLAAP